MKVYLVGGAVRDRLLKLPIKDRDWVVVGATPEEMLKLDYKPVGNDFPVFLHPKTHEEYALARTERKVSKGYTGFAFHADPSVTLEDDLKRRDLTINAIAETPDGKLIDPYNGITDIKNKILRHVSEAFSEDPVRILRVGRFASRYGDFKVHPDTMKLMQVMVKNGEVDALVPERVWQELHRTLALPYPQRFFEILSDCGALPILFPELEPNLQRSMELLQKAAQLGVTDIICFAVLTSQLDTDLAKNLCARIRAPNPYRDLAILVAKYKDKFAKAAKLNAEEVLTLLENLDVFRRPERFTDYLQACEICTGKNAKYLRQAFQAAKAVSIELEGLQGQEIKHKLHVARKTAIEKIKL